MAWGSNFAVYDSEGQTPACPWLLQCLQREQVALAAANVQIAWLDAWALIYRTLRDETCTNTSDCVTYN